MTESISLHWIDWTIIITYIIFSLGVGMYFSKRAGKNTEEYFLSGRSLPWWIVGTSMVATTFAADTPSPKGDGLLPRSPETDCAYHKGTAQSDQGNVVVQLIPVLCRLGSRSSV